MSVNKRIKYLGNAELSNRNRPYRIQLDYHQNGKRVRETIKDITFHPTDTKEIKNEKNRIVNRIVAKLQIELGNSKNGLVSRQLQKGNFIDYFKSLGSKKSENTQVSWDNTLKHLKEFQGNKISFQEITLKWLESFRNFLKDEKKLAQNSVTTYFNKVNAALNQAVKERIISENPIRYIDKPKKVETEIVYLTSEEIQKLIDTDFWDNETKNAFLLSCYTGLRMSDIKSLEWKHIEDGKIQLTQTKTKNSVYIPLNENALNLLENQKHNEKNVFKLSEYNSSINRTFKKLIKIAKINKKVHFHCGRHSFATLLVSEGVNIFTISKLMGHKDIKSTLVYAKVIDSEKEKAVNSMKTFKI